MWGDVAIAFLLAFIVTFMATPYTIKIAHKVGAVDIPKDERRMHKKAMPKFGGPAVILGFLVSVIYLLIVMSMENTINLFGPESYGMKLLGMFLGIVVLSITCIIDDIKTIYESLTYDDAMKVLKNIDTSNMSIIEMIKK